MEGSDRSGAPLPADLRDRLSVSMDSATKAERQIAHYMLTNLRSLPFETAATVAAKIGVSEASVGRYARTIGFRHFKDLKHRLQADFGDAAWMIGDRLRDFHDRSRHSDTERAAALERELAAIVAVHEIAASPEYRQVLERLASLRHVYVAGFQTERCHALQLAHGLQYLRPGVALADVEGANFAEILLEDPAQTCLVLIEARRYSRLARDLATQAQVRGIAVTLITDPYCDWGRAVASEMFAVPTDFNHFWDATSAMSSLIGQMVNGVFHQLGAGVEDRMAQVSSLYGTFIGHTGAKPRTGPSSASKKI
jgi:DNA-binding MurR/RpiR family transcriptional regulator